MRKSVILTAFLALSLALVGPLAAKAKKPKAASAKAAKVVIEMAKGGTIEAELYPDLAPITVANFVKLAESKFYDGLNFHRVEPGFVIQGGDPNGNGSGGPGWTIKGEFTKAKKHVKGTLSMARTPDPDSAGSQFFICLGDAPFLDGQYAIFGQVTKGQDVVDGVRIGDKMKSVRIIK
jgi:cyclophilin family peptidyl-prolyl cis-trans isomerase